MSADSATDAAATTVEVVFFEHDPMLKQITDAPSMTRFAAQYRNQQLRALLSPRQYEILAYAAGDHTIEETGRALGLARQTVKNHRGSAVKILGVDSMNAACYRFRELGGWAIWREHAKVV